MSDHGSDLCICSHARWKHSPKGICRMCSEIECNGFYAPISKDPVKIQTERQEIDDLCAKQLKLIIRIRWERDYAVDRIEYLERALRRVRYYFECNDGDSITSILDDIVPEKTETKETTPT